MPAVRLDKILLRFARLGLALILSCAVLSCAVACGGKGSPAALAGRPSRPAVVTAPAVAIELRRWTAPREVVRVGLQGVVIGPEAGPLAWKLFAAPRRADEVWYFLGTYAPFTGKAGPEEISFHGRGRTRAGAAEQRMIREWTRQVATEAVGGLGDAAYGLALAWHQGGASGICSDLTLSLPGEAVASGCGWPGEVRGRLDPASLSRVYAWFDRLKPFQSGAEEPESPGGTRNGSLDTRVIFAAKGSHPASAAEEAEIRSFAASLFAELAARRPNPAPVLTALAGAPPAEPPARFLLPANAASPKAEEVPLRFPEKPPAPASARNAGSPPLAALPTSPPPPGNPGR
jgi:hypothetical protein